MLNHEQKNETIVSMMEALEDVHTVKQVCSAVVVLKFEDFDANMYQNLQNAMRNNIQMLEFLETIFSQAPKVIDNDAVMSHIDAVMTAE